MKNPILLPEEAEGGKSALEDAQGAVDYHGLQRLIGRQPLRIRKNRKRGTTMRQLMTFLVLGIAWMPACDSKKPKESPPKGTVPPALLGEDSDHDGIRDDIKAYVDAMPESDATKKALQQYSRAFQGLISAQNKEESHEAGVRLLDALQCVYAHDSDNANKVTHELKTRILNTPERLTAYLHATGMLSGMSFTQRSLKDWPQSCGEK